MPAGSGGSWSRVGTRPRWPSCSTSRSPPCRWRSTLPEDRGPSAGELALMLADDVEHVAEALNLDVRRRTPRTLYCMSPMGGSEPKLEVQLAPIRGKWNDWRAGRYGDALGLVAYGLGFEDPKSKEGVKE